MKLLGSIIISVLVMLGAVAAFGLEIPLLYDSPFVAPALIALFDMVVRLGTTLLFVILSGIVAGVLGFSIILLLMATGTHTSDSSDKMIFSGLWGFSLMIMGVFWHPYIMVTSVLPKLPFSIDFSYWQFFAVTSIIMLLGLITGNSINNE